MIENSPINGTIHILLIEDSKSDVTLIKEFLKETNTNYVLHVANDGVKALKFMHACCKHTTNYCPDIIILDLNLPRINGIEVLKEIKHNNDLKKIPVIILTTSTAEEDIKNCYSNHANCYLVKPSNYTDFESTMNALKEFWFNKTNLP